MPILKAAYLWLCPSCQLHAHIFCGDGTKSRVFATKKGGQEVLCELVEAGKIDTVELKFLQDEIAKTSLIPRNDVIDDAARAMAHADTTDDDFDFRLSASRMSDLLMGQHGGASKPDKSKLN